MSQQTPCADQTTPARCPPSSRQSTSTTCPPSRRPPCPPAPPAPRRTSTRRTRPRCRPPRRQMSSRCRRRARACPPPPSARRRAPRPPCPPWQRPPPAAPGRTASSRSASSARCRPRRSGRSRRQCGPSSRPPRSPRACDAPSRTPRPPRAAGTCTRPAGGTWASSQSRRAPRRTGLELLDAAGTHVCHGGKVARRGIAVVALAQRLEDAVGALSEVLGVPRHEQQLRPELECLLLRQRTRVVAVQHKQQRIEGDNARESNDGSVKSRCGLLRHTTRGGAEVPHPQTHAAAASTPSSIAATSRSACSSASANGPPAIHCRRRLFLITRPLPEPKQSLYYT